MTASGTAGYGTEARRLLRPRRCSARSSSSRSPRSSGRAIRRHGCTRRRWACSTPSGCRVQVSSTGSPATVPALVAPERPSSPASGAAASTSTAGPPTCSRGPAGQSSRSRSTCRARTSRGGTPSSPTTPSCRPRCAATTGCGRPRWAKLSANTDRIVDVAGAVRDAGAEAVTCINTLLGMVYDRESPRRRPRRRRRRAVGPGDPPDRRAGRPRRPRARCPICPSSASAASSPGGTRDSSSSPARAAVQVGTATLRRPPSADPCAARELGTSSPADLG